MGNLVKYGSFEAEAAAEEREESESSGRNDFMKLNVGKNVLRILPPPIGKRSPFMVVYQHFIAVGSLRKSFICARVQAKKHCAICAKAKELKESRSRADQTLANDLFARRRIFCNVINRSEPEKGPQILGIGKTVHEQLLALREDEDAGGNYTHPEEGFDIIIERTGSTKNDTKYNVRAARNVSPLADDAETMNAWIEGQHDLDQLAKIPDEADVEAALAGEDTSDEDRGGRRAGGGAQRSSGGRGTGRTSRRNAEDDAIDTDGEDVD